MANVVNQEALVPNDKCSQKYKFDNWKCLYAQYLTEQIDTPLYIINSQYDAWTIPNTLNESCVSLSFYEKSDLNLDLCDADALSYIEKYR